ncbi:ABC transporter-related protein [Pyrolobus fumarii 1A]|uniref:ABC transporter-related protein n=1 Tax=Pyrolobus fumarii (strain DSM 11204 / 1A) TaxID=694429 RepID=G0EH68_PYRF1|nr:ABC transporter ATP-binding protein [Pyrolobus fumarii]AEM39292.1 ABC transporter-related protein [Pyrolobus fumarii 1A]
MHAIEAKNLVKRYRRKSGLVRRRVREVLALRGVTFTVEKGEVFGLLGPNGAGKTTTVKIISTILLPDDGEARVMGHDVVTEADEVRKLIGVSLSVERGFWYVMSGRENLTYFGLLRGLRGAELQQRIDHVLKLVGLDRVADKPVEEYSLGMKAKLALARALLHDPEVLILDEPTLGLDPTAARRVRELLVMLAKEEGKTIFITTHNMYEAEIICDRVAIIHSGRIIAIGTPHELKRLIIGYVPVVVVGWGPTEAIEDIVKTTGLRYTIDARGDRVRLRLLAPSGEEEKLLARLVSSLVSRRFHVIEARVEEPSLEDVFIKLVSSGS